MQIVHTMPDESQVYTHTIPQFGLGVFLMSKPGECRAFILAALAAGYTDIATLGVSGFLHLNDEEAEGAPAAEA